MSDHTLSKIKILVAALAIHEDTNPPATSSPLLIMMIYRNPNQSKSSKFVTPHQRSSRIPRPALSRLFFAPLFAISLAIATPVQASAEEWTWRAPTLSGNLLGTVAVSTTNPQIVVAAGQIGTILTKKGDSSWKSLRLPELNIIVAMHWTGTQFVGGGLGKDGKGIILRSADGVNWSQTAFPTVGTSGAGPAASVFSGSRAIILTTDGYTFISDDAAQNWREGPRLPSANLSDTWPAMYWDLATDGKGRWVAVGTGGTITTSVDDGNTWIKKTQGLEDYYHIETDGGSFMLEGNLNRISSTVVVYRSSNGLIWNDATVIEPALTPDAVTIKVEKFFGVPGSFIAASFTTGEDYWYESKDGGVTWQRLILSADSDRGFKLYYVGDVASSTSGALTMVGRGGLIVSLSPRNQAEVRQTLESKPYLGSSIPLFFTSAGGNGKFLATANYPTEFVSSTDGVNFLPVSSESGWSPSAVTWDGGGFLGAHIDYRPGGSDSVSYLPHVVFETSADGSAWQESAALPPAPAPSLWNGYQVAAGLAKSAAGRVVVLVVEQSWDESASKNNSSLTVYHWNGENWSELTITDADFVDNDADKSMLPQIQWDGSQFLFLTPRGALLRSASGDPGTWSPLPALPPDSDKYLGDNFTSIFGPGRAPAANVVYSFASDGKGTIVARPGKLAIGIEFENWTNGSLSSIGADRFFVLTPGATNWTMQQPPQTAADRLEGNKVLWNGSIFASANAAGYLHTSPDGLTWTRRELGADVKVLTWTGTQFVGLTEDSSVITHPTGLSKSLSDSQALGFAQWLQSYGLTGVAAQPGAAPAGDGISNLLKYAFNLDPNRHEGIGRPLDEYRGLPFIERSVAGDYLQLIYYRDPSKTNIQVIPVWRSKLQDSLGWNEVSDCELLGTQDGIERWRARIPMLGGQQQGFIRLNVLMQ